MTRRSTLNIESAPGGPRVSGRCGSRMLRQDPANAAETAFANRELARVLSNTTMHFTADGQLVGGVQVRERGEVGR